MMEEPFYERYPSKYKEKDGARIFKDVAYVSELHDLWLDQEGFYIVGSVLKHPRYTNAKDRDPWVKMFLDGAELPEETSWGIPIMNGAAAYKSLGKYDKAILAMSEEQVSAMNRAWEWTSKHFGVYMANSKVIDHETALQKLDMSTSPGYPFNVFYKTKKEMFLADPTVADWIKEDWEKLKDRTWITLFGNSLKEELRTLEKLEQNSIRTFLAGSVECVAHGTRLFVDMNEKMYASHLQSSSAIGMSPYKGNWNLLYRKLNIFKNGYALDESQYDSSLRCYMMWGCARLRWSMLREQDRTPENLARIKQYYLNIINTVIVTAEGVLVMKKGGNPSGSVNTISDNTLILYTLLSYAWILTAPEDLNSYEQFEMHTAKALVGDDNTWTVSDAAHEYYNAKTVIAQWKKIGVTTTTDSLEPRRAAELDFLSAHTVFLKPGIAVPIYERQKLMTALLYADKKKSTPSLTLMRAAGLLAIGWVDIPFRNFCRGLIEWMILKYDKLLVEDLDWIQAKTQILTDERYFQAFTGMSELHPQSVELSGRTVKLRQPDKIRMSNLQPKGTGRNPGRKQKRNRRGKGAAPATKKATQQKKTTRPRPRRTAGSMQMPQGTRTIAMLESSFDAACRKRHISPTGCTWLKEVLDPMHDHPLGMRAGTPDRTTGASVVSRIRQSMDIVMPDPTVNPHFAGVNTWNAHIIMSPWLQEVSFRETSRVNNLLIAPSGNKTLVGGVQSFATPTNGKLDFDEATPTGMSPHLGSLVIESDYSSGVGRLISIGVEVINTTAALTAQGTVTCWRAPEPHLEPSSFCFSSPDGSVEKRTSTAYSGQMYRYPPIDTASALLYESTQWRAVDGCYMIAQFHDDNPPQAVNYIQPYFEFTSGTEDATYDRVLLNDNVTPLWVPELTPYVDPTSGLEYFGAPGIKTYPINQMGAMFTGLSVNTTLTMNVIYYYENFPSLANKKLLALAQPASPHDPIAMEYMQRIARQMPVAVPFAENPAGEYFAIVLDALSGAAVAIGAATGQPLLGAAAGAALTWGATQLR